LRLQLATKFVSIIISGSLSTASYKDVYRTANDCNISKKRKLFEFYA